MQVSEGSDTFEFRSPHGMKAAHSRLRTFAGIAVRHLQHFNHPGRAWHDLSGPQDTLTVVLAEIGGRCQARTNLHRPAALERQRPNHISFVPAEMRVWGYTDNMESVRELRLSFDRKSLGDWFGTDLDPGKAGNPELMFHDKRAVECARLLAAECDASDPSMGLYGEGLTIALLSACFQGRPQKENSGLSVSQLRLVLDFIHEHLDLFRFCLPACPSGRPVILAICEDVQGVYRSIPASLSTEHPDRQSAGATADERREPFHGGCGNRFCRSEPLHADVQEGHWSYTTRVASESHPLENAI